jgi:ATP-binding cassette subfamily C protein
VIAGLALVTLFVLRPISRRAESYTHSLSTTTQEIARRVADVLGNLKFFRSTGTRTRAEALFATSYDEYATQFRQTLVAPYAVHLGYELTALVFIITMIAVAISGASKLTGATLILLAVFWRLSPQLRLLQGGMVQVRVQYPWLLKWQERVATAGAHQEQPSGKGTPSFAERLTVEHVSFSFPGASARVLDDVSWELRRGGVVALVGESGAGKTTMLDLISGLLVPTEGTVQLDGLPLTMLDVDQWQSHIGLVLDQSPLFHATVRENIVGDGEPDDARVWEALASANAATFVRALPAELDTVIGERGGRLSGGQRQRIGLARALYRQPWLLILDEATSALDSVSEGAVLEALESLRGDVSMLIVAHRLTTVRMADRIYVLENGRTVQTGAWDELLADPEGTFARMAAKQGIFGGPASVASH